MLLTFCVLGLMLFLYSTRIIRVTQRFMVGVMMATGAVALVYLIDWVLSMFHTGVPFINDSGTVGIVISLVIVGIAAANLLVDFAVIESNVQQGATQIHGMVLRHGPAGHLGVVVSGTPAPALKIPAETLSGSEKTPFQACVFAPVTERLKVHIWNHKTLPHFIF
jgi:hypothetical protein